MTVYFTVVLCQNMSYAKMSLAYAWRDKMRGVVDEIHVWLPPDAKGSEQEAEIRELVHDGLTVMYGGLPEYCEHYASNLRATDVLTLTDDTIVLFRDLKILIQRANEYPRSIIFPQVFNDPVIAGLQNKHSRDFSLDGLDVENWDESARCANYVHGKLYKNNFNLMRVNVKYALREPTSMRLHFACMYGSYARTIFSMITTTGRNELHNGSCSAFLTRVVQQRLGTINYIVMDAMAVRYATPGQLQADVDPAYLAKYTELAQAVQYRNHMNALALGRVAGAAHHGQWCLHSIQNILCLHSMRRIKHPHTMEDYIERTGYSGSESAVIEVCEALRGRNKSVLSVNKHLLLQDADDVTHNGIVYARVPPRHVHYDVVLADIYTYDFGEFDIGTHCLRRGGWLVVWLQVFINQTFLDQLREELIERPDVRVIFVCVSDMVRRYIVEKWQGARTVVVPNAINPIFCIPPVNERNFERICFHAVPGRGLDVARAVAYTLGRDVHMMTYADSTGKGKRDVVKFLDASGYFIYPLVHNHEPYTVHHDTYACVIHEAMARGVIVISWDVAMLREVYGDNIILLQPPAYKGYDPHAPTGNNHAMLNKASVRMFVQAIQDLERDLPRREALRHRAREWAQARTWNFDALFNSL